MIKQMQDVYNAFTSAYHRYKAGQIEKDTMLLEAHWFNFQNDFLEAWLGLHARDPWLWLE
jgi:hypothetical protein